MASSQSWINKNHYIKSPDFLTDVIFILDREEINSIFQGNNCQSQFKGDGSTGLHSICYYHIHNMVANKMYTDVKQANHSQGSILFYLQLLSLHPIWNWPCLYKRITVIFKDKFWLCGNRYKMPNVKHTNNYFRSDGTCASVRAHLPQSCLTLCDSMDCSP